MKKSSTVTISLLASIAFTACQSRSLQTRRCVDRNNAMVDDSFCKNEETTLHPPGYVPYYHWYYGGSGARRVGSPIYTGSHGSSISHPSTPSGSHGVTRGGFGGTGKGGGAS